MKDVLNALIGIALFVFLEWFYLIFYVGVNLKKYKVNSVDLFITSIMASMSFLVWWSIK
jgi:hypothetical protein